jgi:signal transduction histidine kinase
MNRPTVLILTRDRSFSREITANWPGNDHAPFYDDPEFTVLEEGFSRDLQGSPCDLAIADASSLLKNSLKKNKNSQRAIPKDYQTTNLKQALLAAGKPAILIHSDPTGDLYSLQGSMIELRREPGIWPALTVLIGREILRRRQAESRASEAEKICAAAQNEATLGRYMVEMRSNVNNALTTILGNAELLGHEPGLPVTATAQADAIRNMALRLHEVFQRFSSLEKEFNVAAREPAKKAATAAGR